MAVSLTGIFSGIDSDSIISQLIAADSKPMQLLQAQVTTDQSEETAEQSVVTSLTQLQSAANALTGTANLNSLTASSSNSQALTATASTAATEGTHSVVINQLASAAQEIQAGVVQKETWTLNQQAASADDTFLSAADLAGGTQFKFQFGTEPAVSVDLSSYASTGITLNQLVSTINSAAGYTAASAVQNNGQYQLQVRALDAGASETLAVTSSGAPSALSSLSQFTQTTKGVAGTDTLIGAGSFVYTYNGVTRTIQTTAATTLGNLQDLINNDAGNPGVTASVLDHPVDGDNNQEFHLVLTGNSTGAKNTITVSSATTLAGFAPGASDWTATQQAQDSQIQVDGYPATGWLDRSSNTVTDVVPGVTLNLTGLSPTGVTVTVARDTTQLTTNLQSLVSAYNSAVTNLGTYTSYNTTNQTAGLLQGDSTFTDLLDPIRDPLVNSLGGFATGSSSDFSVAGQLGLTLNSDGTITLDTTALDSALSTNYKGVLDLVGAQNEGQSDNSLIQFGGATSATAGGTYQVQVNYDGSGNISSALMRLQGQTAWTAATVNGNVVSGAKGSPEEGLTLTASWDGASASESANVTVRQGLATQMYNSLSQILDSQTGVLAEWKTGMDSQIKDLNDNITTMQDQLNQEQTDLQNEFVNLETTLAQLDEQMQAIKSLSGNSSSSSSSTATSVGAGTATLSSSDSSSSSSGVSNDNQSYTTS